MLYELRSRYAQRHLKYFLCDKCTSRYAQRHLQVIMWSVRYCLILRTVMGRQFPYGSLTSDCINAHSVNLVLYERTDRHDKAKRYSFAALRHDHVFMSIEYSSADVVHPIVTHSLVSGTYCSFSAGLDNCSLPSSGDITFHPQHECTNATHCSASQNWEQYSGKVPSDCRW